MSKKIFTVIFLCVLVVGIFIRFYKLGFIPNSLDWDEVSQGYNAYSILETGKDEFGIAFPSVIRSLNDYKPPIYIYLTTIPVKLFGLNPFSARFASAFFGSLSILLVFYLVLEVLKRENYAKYIALLSMFFFSISPFSIQFSRTGFDANVGVFLVILGTWLFIRGLSNKLISNIFLGTLSLGFSVYSAHSEKVFAVLFFLCLLFYGRKFFLTKKLVLIGLIALFGFLNIFWFFNPQTRARSNGVLFTASSLSFMKPSLNDLAYDKANNDTLGAIIHNRRFVYVGKYLENYLTHFNLNHIFVTGDNARHHAPEVGILYLSSLPFILIGIFFVVRKKIYPAFIFLAWLIIAPIASSFAIDAPNFQRALIFLPTFHIFEALGWFYFFSIIPKLRFGRLGVGVIVIIFSLNVIYYLHQYFAYTNTDYAKYWQYGYREAINYVKRYEDTGKKIFFANDIEQGYIFYLFYNNYNPNKYISSGGSNRINSRCYSIDNAYFGDCKDIEREGDIFITSKQPSFLNLQLVDRVMYPGNNETAIWISQYREF